MRRALRGSAGFLAPVWCGAELLENRDEAFLSHQCRELYAET